MASQGQSQAAIFGGSHLFSGGRGDVGFPPETHISLFCCPVSMFHKPGTQH